MANKQIHDAIKLESYILKMDSSSNFFFNFISIVGNL